MIKNLKDLPHKIKPTIFITPSALEALKSELIFLKKIKRLEVSERIKRAREFGALDENAEYEAALDEQALMENRIEYLEESLRDSKVISDDSPRDEVVIGSTVLIEMNGKREEFMIVGKVEANPLKKKISNESPVGSVLIGSKVGETKEVKTPQLCYKVKILDIK